MLVYKFTLIISANLVRKGTKSTNLDGKETKIASVALFKVGG